MTAFNSNISNEENSSTISTNQQLLNNVKIENSEIQPTKKNVLKILTKKTKTVTEKKKKNKKKNALSSNLKNLTLSTITVALVSVASMIYTPSATVKLNSYYASYNYISYSLSIVNYKDQSNLVAVICNDFIWEEQQITDEFVSGYVDNLQPNMEYNLIVKEGNMIIFKQKIHTGEDHYYENQ